MQMRPQAVTRMSRSCQDIGVPATRHRPWRGGVELGRASHGERLVRAFGVELAHEGIEPGLLLQTVETGRAGCLLFRSGACAHAAVLLRMAGLMRSMEMPAAATRPRGGEIVEPLGLANGSPCRCGCDGKRGRGTAAGTLR